MVRLQLQSTGLAGESGEDVDVCGSSSLALHSFSPTSWSSHCPLTVSVSPGLHQVETQGQLLSVTHSSPSPGWIRWQQWRHHPRHATSQESLSWGTSSRWLSADSHWGSVSSHEGSGGGGSRHPVVRTLASQSDQLHVSMACEHCPCVASVAHPSQPHNGKNPAWSSSWAAIMMWIFISRQWVKEWGKHCIPHPFQIVRVAAYGSDVVLLQLRDCGGCQLAVPLSTSDDSFLATLSCHFPQRCAKPLSDVVHTFFLRHWAVVSVDVEVDEMVIGLRITVWQDCDIAEPMSLFRATPQDLCKCSIHCTWSAMKVLVTLMCPLPLPVLITVLVHVISHSGAAMAVQAQYCIVDHKAGDQVDDTADSVEWLVPSCHPCCIVWHIDVSHIFWRITWQLRVCLPHASSSVVEASCHSAVYCNTYLLLVSHVGLLVDAGGIQSPTNPSESGKANSTVHVACHQPPCCGKWRLTATITNLAWR